MRLRRRVRTRILAVTGVGYASAMTAHALQGAIGEDADPTATVDHRELRRRAIAWALWDWGSAAFNAVVTTFVFATYLSSSLFVDPEVAAAGGTEGASAAQKSALNAAVAGNTSTISFVLAIGGLCIALIAPVLGQRSDGSGRRRLWLGVLTTTVCVLMAAMFFVAPSAENMLFGALLLAAGHLFFELASVNYNAMIVQVSTPAIRGRVSGFGWGMGYVGGIVLLLLLLVLFIQSLDGGATGGLLHVASGRDGDALNIRLAVVASAVWFFVFALPVIVRVPEVKAVPGRERVGILDSYRRLFATIARLWRESRQTLLFLAASAVFRDGMAGVFAYGGILAATVFGFSSSEVLYFAVAANVVAGIATFIGGWADDRFGPKPVIVVSLIALCTVGTLLIVVGSGKASFWALGLILCAFVGPVQSASRAFMARISPAGREGEMFGLYATTGRAVSFLTPLLFGLFAAVCASNRYGTIGVVVVLAAGLLLMLPVRGRLADGADARGARGDAAGGPLGVGDGRDGAAEPTR